MADFLKKILVFIFLFNCVEAKDLGNHGHTFPIIETCLLQYLKDKAKNTSDDQLFALQKKLQDRYVKLFKEPKAINLPETDKLRISFFDPTIRTQTDIKDSEGKIIVPKGTLYNPLETISLSENLLFFDGSNLKHVEWAKGQAGKWILTKGKPLDLEESEERSIFFDQMGKLTTQLKIQSIPARVSQMGLLLKIEEIPCE